MKIDGRMDECGKQRRKKEEENKRGKEIGRL